MESGTTLCNRFRIIQKIGCGSFGEIYEAEDLANHMKVAVKLESSRAKAPRLEFESRIYKILDEGICIPKVYFYGATSKYHVLAMDRLGKSLEDIVMEHKGVFSLKTVLMLVDQMISAVEFLHKRNFLHRDIKPDNFLMGIDKTANQVYLIDFGLSKYYRDAVTMQHIPFTSGKSLTGTARYASINAMRGYEQGRRDDMESLAYVWIYMLKGSLPWQGLPAIDQKQKMRKILDVKANTAIEELCYGIPSEFMTYLRAVKNLKFAEEPNYSEYRSLFRRLFLQSGFVYDYKYDWTEVKRKPAAPVTPPAKLGAENKSPRNREVEPIPLYRMNQQKLPVVKRVGTNDKMNVRFRLKRIANEQIMSARTTEGGRLRTAVPNARGGMYGFDVSPPPRKRAGMVSPRRSNPE